MTYCQNCNAEYPYDELLCEDCEAQEAAETMDKEKRDYLNDDIINGLNL